MKEQYMTTQSRKANGYGHTYKIKGTNSWRTVYSVNGRVVTGTAKDKATSRARAKEKLNLLPVGQANQGLTATTMTLGEFLARWLTQEHKTAIAYTTYRRYESLARIWIIPALGKVTLRNLKCREIKTFLSSMANAGQSPRSRQQARALLCVALGAAMELNLIISNPAKEVPNIQLSKKPITPLTSKEVKSALAAAKGTFMEARLHIAMICGLRQGESIGLRWQDIDFDKGVLIVSNQIQAINGIKTFVKLKTASSCRTIVLSDATLSALESHKEILSDMKSIARDKWGDHDLVFPSSTGRPLEASVDYGRWHSILDLCGLPRRSLHNARHTAGTLMYENGVGIETIKRLLGHSSVLITSNTYVHNAEKPLRDAAATIDSFLNEK
jgi:integrase